MNTTQPVAGERIYPRIGTEIRQSSDKKRFTFVISTGSEDRHGTEIAPEGIDFSHFRTNPVVLFNHDYNQIVGRAVSLESKGGRLIAQMEFDDDDPDAQKIKRKVENGFLNAASIGFMVKNVEMDEKRDVFRITESELLEFSIVSVPSNREALVMSRDTNEIRALREEIAQLRQDLTAKPENQQDADLAAESPAVDAIPEGDAEPAAEEPAQETPSDDRAPEVETSNGDSESPKEPRSAQPRKATPLDYARIAQEMIPEIRRSVRRELGKE